MLLFTNHLSNRLSWVPPVGNITIFRFQNLSVILKKLIFANLPTLSNKQNMKSIQTVFIGTGAIAHTHAQAIRLIPNATLAGVFDPNKAAAERFAKTHGVAKVYSSLEDVLSDPKVDAVHLLTPPETHLGLVEKCFDAEKPVLAEKPMFSDPSDAAKFYAALSKSKTACSVNQNMAYFPAFVKFHKMLTDGQLGKLNHIDMSFHPQVKQLVARQFTHWMFASPSNILLELAVHPLSQVLAIVKTIDDVKVSAGKPMMLNSQNGFYPEIMASLRSGDVSIGFHFKVGALYPAWRMTAYCEDGTATIDMMADTLHVAGRTKFLMPLDQALSNVKASVSMIKQARKNLWGYSASQLGVGPRADGFFESIKGSIQNFHASLNGGNPGLTDGAFGARLVEVCGEIGRQLPAIAPMKCPPPSLVSSPVSNDAETVLLIGGTGFIGRPTVEVLLKEGYKVRVMARGTRNLPDMFVQKNVEVVPGDVKNSQHLDTAMKDVRLVVNLAHGGGGATLAEMKASMVDSAVAVVNSAARAGVKRIVHIGSVAGLFLGDKNEIITGATPPDPQPEKRGDYAHAKALADLAFSKACEEKGIEWVILRPGVVVGDGTAPLHNGVGHTNNDQHVIGWNQGENNLPFVLAEDCATAILGSIQNKAAANKSYNLAGDVSMSAKEYMRELTAIQSRPLEFHPSSINALYAVEIWKYAIKTIGGKKIPFPSTRDFTSRGMFARFDCTDAKNDLGWKPLADRDKFIEKAIKIHA